VAPTANLIWVAVVTTIEDNVAADVEDGVVEVGATIVKLMGGLVIPERDAEIFAVPTATPVARPVGSIVAVI